MTCVNVAIKTCYWRLQRSRNKWTNKHSWVLPAVSEARLWHGIQTQRVLPSSQGCHVWDHAGIWPCGQISTDYRDFVFLCKAWASFLDLLDVFKNPCGGRTLPSLASMLYLHQVQGLLVSLSSCPRSCAIGFLCSARNREDKNMSGMVSVVMIVP